MSLLANRCQVLWYIKEEYTTFWVAMDDLVLKEEKEKKLTRVKEDIVQSESSFKALEKKVSEESKRTPQIIHEVETKLSEIPRTKIILQI